MGSMLWDGAFEKETAKKIIEFNSSENAVLDQKLIFYDILGSIAHVKMLGNQKIISKKEALEITNALLKIKNDYQNGKFKLDQNLEDVHMNVESAVTKITQHGKKMHTARSRNDQVLVDMRLYMRDEILNIFEKIITFQNALIELAKKEGKMVAYTHTRLAQPITVSFWCDATVRSLERDIDRLKNCYEHTNQNPLGAGAISGTNWEINRKETAKMLGFDSVQENALDAINSRGECEAELAACLSFIMMKFSRLCEELLWLSEKRLIKIPEEFTTGSSMMPNKRNADVLELIRGRTARVYSNLMHILTTTKGLMTGYNSDMQETKFAIMQAIETTKECVELIAIIMPKLDFNQERIVEELEQGFTQATELADFLSMKGMPFREAHETTGKIIRYCEKNGKVLSNISAEEMKNLTGFDIENKELKTALALEKTRLNVRINKKEMEEDQGWLRVQQNKIKKSFEHLLQI